MKTRTSPNYPVYRLLQLLIAAALIATASGAVAAGYHTANGKIFKETGEEVRIRGISHFGFNDRILRPQYLWKQGWKEQIADIKQRGFNAIRVPFVPDALHDTRVLIDPSFETYMIGQSTAGAENHELAGKTPLQALDLWMDEAERQGLYIVLDFHSLTNKRQEGYPLWFMTNYDEYHDLIYDGTPYDEQRWIQDLVLVAQRYANRPHFLGIDIYNEPHGAARWNGGSAQWKTAAENAAAAILAVNPNLLIFVQGVSDGEGQTAVPINWGENLLSEVTSPLNIQNNKLVLSPHTYGPDVYMKSSFPSSEHPHPEFPTNLPSDWDTLFGQLRQTHAIVVGEFGGYLGTGPTGTLDATWQNAFVDYLIDRGICNSFYWVYTPNSGDTGGLYYDHPETGALVFRQDKMDLLNRLWSTCGGGTSSTGSLTIFDDAVTAAWQLSGWTSTVAIQNQIVKTGTTAVKVDANTWGGLSFDSRDVNWTWTDQQTSAFTRLSFDVSAGPTVGAAMSSLEASLDLGYGTAQRISDYIPSPSFEPGVWYHVEIPISAMNPQGAATFRKIALQNNSQTDLTFYVDNVALIPGSTSPPGGPLQSCANILPLGDSITAGFNGGYRVALYQGLQQNNCGVSYVGTLPDANNPPDNNPDLPDKHHEGHPGFYIGDIARDVNGWLNTTHPDIVLLMIGTNDTAWWTNDNAATHASHHDALIDQIQAAQVQAGRPDAWIFVASIPPQRSLNIHVADGGPDMCPNYEGPPTPCTLGDRAVLAQQFNAAIQQNVATRVAAGENVRFVDVFSALGPADLDPGPDPYGGVHPKDEAAYAKIGAKFLDAIRAALGQ